MQSTDTPMKSCYLLFLTILATTTCFAESSSKSLDKKVEDIAKVIKTADLKEDKITENKKRR